MNLTRMRFVRKQRDPLPKPALKAAKAIAVLIRAQGCPVNQSGVETIASIIARHYKHPPCEKCGNPTDCSVECSACFMDSVMRGVSKRNDFIEQNGYDQP